MNSQKREMNETLKHGGTLAEKSNVGDATALHDEYRTKQQEGQSAAVQQQKKHKVFPQLFVLANDSICTTHRQEITSQNAVTLTCQYDYLHICS